MRWGTELKHEAPLAQFVSCWDEEAQGWKPLGRGQQIVARGMGDVPARLLLR